MDERTVQLLRLEADINNANYADESMISVRIVCTSAGKRVDVQTTRTAPSIIIVLARLRRTCSNRGRAGCSPYAATARST